MQQQQQARARDAAIHGYSMFSVLGNLAYAGMRAQGSDNKLARTLAFVAGFPGTLITYFLVDEGSERAYGVDLPRRPSLRTPTNVPSNFAQTL